MDSNFLRRDSLTSFRDLEMVIWTVTPKLFPSSICGMWREMKRSMVWMEDMDEVRVLE